MEIALPEFKKKLAEFLALYKIDNYHGKIYVHCVGGNATTIEMRRTERVKDLVEGETVNTTNAKGGSFR